MIEFPRPELPAKASAAVFTSARLGIAEWASPKSFRVETGLAWLAEQAFLGKQDQNFWWVGPDFSSCANAMTLLRSALSPGSYAVPGRQAAMIFPNGAILWFRSGENTSALYSDSTYAAVVDNAIHLPEKSWQALRETLANTRAPARLISTVAGRDNWFNALARQAERGEAPDTTYARFTALDLLEEGLLTQADLDYARATLPDHIFRALYLAQPYDDRIEAAHKASDPKLMTDAELAIIAGLDPAELLRISDEVLHRICAEAEAPPILN